MIKSLLDPKYPQIANISSGRIRGFKWRRVYEFLGVPYGQAKRWEKALAPTPWKGIKNCMEYGNICPAFSGYRQWDCGKITRPYHV